MRGQWWYASWEFEPRPTDPYHLFLIPNAASYQLLPHVNQRDGRQQTPGRNGASGPGGAFQRTRGGYQVQPVKIMDLARRMVELSGLTVKDEQHPDGDIEIEVTGLRPGEKLYEELLIGDNPKPTVHPRIMKAHEDFMPWAEFEGKLRSLELALNSNDVGVIRLMMQQLVAGYTPSDDIVDWVYLEQEAGAQAS